MFTRWLSKQPNMQRHTTLDATLAEIRLLDSGLVARACGLVAPVALWIARSGNSMVRLASGNGRNGDIANLTILTGLAGVASECVPFEDTLPPSNDVAPDYQKTYKHQSHFRERCLNH